MSARSRRALLYCRISQDREGAGLGVARQREDCEALAATLGWEVAEVIVDNDVSASTGRARPGYTRLLDALAAGRGDAVVSWHPDRLHRSPRELEHFIDVVERAGASVATVRAGSLDLGSPAGRAVARTLGAWARYEVEAKSDRQRRKGDELAAAGRWSGGTRPFGYGDDGVTVHSAEAAEVVAMTSAVLAGTSLAAVAADLNTRGVPTSSGRPWGTTQVRQVVLRPRNAGLRQHRGSVTGPAAWPALVPEDQWEAAVEVLSDPVRRRSASNIVRHLGAGLYRCGVCGSPCRSASASSPGGYRTVYRCKARGGGQPHAARHADPVDALVVDIIVGRLCRADAVDLLADPGSGEATAAGLAQVRSRLQAAAEAFADGGIDAEQLRAITRRLRAREADLQAAVPVPPPPALAALPASDPAVVRERWEALDMATQRAVLDALAVVTLLPGPRGRVFRPELVQVSWK